MKILETVLYAENLEAAHGFYVGILGLEPISFDPQRDLFLRLDGSVLIVFRASKTVIQDAIVPPAGHAAFAASEEEMESWRARLESAGIPIIKEISWPNGARSIYFNDPAGNVLEFATPNLWH